MSPPQPPQPQSPPVHRADASGVAGARGEADAQNITVLAMWMIEHPGTEEERDEPHARGDGSDACTGAAASAGGKSGERSSFLCSSGDPGTDTAEMEEGFSEGWVAGLVNPTSQHTRMSWFQRL